MVKNIFVGVLRDLTEEKSYIEKDDRSGTRGANQGSIYDSTFP